MLTPPPERTKCKCFVHYLTYLMAFVEKFVGTELQSLLIKLGENIVGFVEHKNLKVDTVI